MSEQLSFNVKNPVKKIRLICHTNQASISFRTNPPLTISIGRSPGAMSSFSPAIPSWWYTVIARSSGEIGVSSGSLAVGPDEPTVAPRFIPPPAITTVKTFGQ